MAEIPYSVPVKFTTTVYIVVNANSKESAEDLVQKDYIDTGEIALHFPSANTMTAEIVYEKER
tara:strand:- start:1658 stop:1846 length:189 start_codon:yes stop_codon:yes gene_type:complete